MAPLQVVNSNAMQHAAMLLVPLVPQPTQPPSPESGMVVTRETRDLEERRAIREAQDSEYAQAETDDLQRQHRQPEEQDAHAADLAPADLAPKGA